MAIWQYGFLVIPKESITENYNCIFKNNQTKYLPKTESFWTNSNLDISKMATEIDKFVERADWSKENYYAWKGNNDNEDNDGHISLDNITNKITEFYFRVDLREKSNIENFLYGLVKICTQNELIILNLKGEILEPKIEIIIENLKKSNAVSFLKNPNEHIKNLAEE